VVWLLYSAEGKSKYILVPLRLPYEDLEVLLATSDLPPLSRARSSNDIHPYIRKAYLHLHPRPRPHPHPHPSSWRSVYLSIIDLVNLHPGARLVAQAACSIRTATTVWNNSHPLHYNHCDTIGPELQATLRRP